MPGTHSRVLHSYCSRSITLWTLTKNNRWSDDIKMKVEFEICNGPAPSMSSPQRYKGKKPKVKVDTIQLPRSSSSIHCLGATSQVIKGIPFWHPCLRTVPSWFSLQMKCQEKKEHPTIPLLTKYLYCYQPEQTAFKDISDKASSLSSSASGINQGKLSKALGAPGQVQVKVERPHHHALQEVLKYGQAMKGRLEKEFNTCSSLLKDLKAAGHSATATAEGQIHTGLKEVEKWLDKLRLDLHAGSTVAPDAEKAACESATQKITSFKAEGMIHQDGLKAVKQRLLSLLREFGTKWLIASVW